MRSSAKSKSLVFDESGLDRGTSPEEIGKAMRIDDAIGRYLVFLKSCLQRSRTFDGLKVVVDCANGAAYKVGPDVLDELGVDVIALGVDPDGKNINRDGGAVNPAPVQEAVLRENADIGVALDGDADRAILVDGKGQVLDGDDVLAIMGRALAAKGQLAANTVVATVMSNLGLDKSLAEAGIAPGSHRSRRPRGLPRDALQWIQSGRGAVRPSDLHGLFNHRRWFDHHFVGARAYARCGQAA